MKGNTVGSRSNNLNLAYVAGFLDGDGSLMLQVKRRSDTFKKWRIMATICFYQDSRHSYPLNWIRKELGIGYISNRNDGMTELRINGYDQVATILSKLMPYIRFKKIQVKSILEALKLIKSKDIKKFTNEDYKTLIDLLLKVQKSNYQSSHKKTKEDLKKIFGLTP